MLTHIYSVLIEKDICDHQDISNKFPCVCVYFSSGDLFIFLVRVFPFFFHFLNIQFSTLLVSILVTDVLCNFGFLGSDGHHGLWDAGGNAARPRVGLVSCTLCPGGSVTTRSSSTPCPPSCSPHHHVWLADHKSSAGPAGIDAQTLRHSTSPQEAVSGVRALGMSQAGFAPYSLF